MIARAAGHLSGKVGLPKLVMVAAVMIEFQELVVDGTDAAENRRVVYETDLEAKFQRDSGNARVGEGK